MKKKNRSTQLVNKTFTVLYKTHTHSNTHIVLIANVDIGDLDLNIFDDLSDELLHKSVLFLRRGVLCQTNQIGVQA